MKNTIRSFRIIALAAIIGFTVIGCITIVTAAPPTIYSGTISGTYFHDNSYHLTFEGNSFTGVWDGAPISGTFTVSDTNLTINATSGHLSPRSPTSETFTIIGTDAASIRDTFSDVWHKQAAPPAAVAAAAVPARPVLANGTYTFMPRPQGVHDGAPENIFISKITVTDDFITVHFEDAPEAGEGYARGTLTYSSSWTRNIDPVILFDADDATSFVQLTRTTSNSQGRLVTAIFPKLNANRLRMVNKAGAGTTTFSSIDITTAVYEP
jgi:hypothetical protein